jgi:peptidoglycan/xylan/chitin deacetylase (PgdA/CDA1 family)
LSYSRFRQTALHLAARTISRMPGAFRIARLLGPSYSLRCVVFHHISDMDSPLTAGINVRTPPSKFEAALRFLTAHYKPVRLEDVLEASAGGSLPPRAVLVTFDDAYASVVEVAAPLCRKYGVPAVFFVNAAFLDNRRLTPDNLVCYVANVQGMQTINGAVRTVRGHETSQLQSMTEVFSRFFPSITLTEREAFLEALRHLAGITECRLAEETALYLTSKQLCSLASFDFEIGNHTYSHVHCRRLSQADFSQEIDKNKVELEAVSGAKVRSFSQPYGSSKDLTPELARHLRDSGHEAVFLSESVANLRSADPFHLDRVNPRVQGDDTFFLDLEILPRLRAVRNRFLHGSGMIQVDRISQFRVN